MSTAPSVPPEITESDVRAAAQRIRELAHRTPVLTSRTFDVRAGARAVFKCENLQLGGAFKIRGAANFVLSIPKAELRRGVTGFSSGNHAQAVAIAARHVGAKATIIMPADAPRSKREATEGYGARVIPYVRSEQDREEVCARIAAETGATTVPPFDHPWIVAGQATAALELLEDHPGLDAVITPVGGGGLLAGSAIIAKALKPGIRVFGAEPAEANDTFLSFRKGERMQAPSQNTIADGLRSPMPGAITFPIIQKNVEDILLVSEYEIRETVKFLLTRLKILVEPSGAVAAAAVLFHKLPPDVKSAGVILSGGNVDLDFLATLSS